MTSTSKAHRLGASSIRKGPQLLPLPGSVSAPKTLCLSPRLTTTTFQIGKIENYCMERSTSEVEGCSWTPCQWNGKTCKAWQRHDSNLPNCLGNVSWAQITHQNLTIVWGFKSMCAGLQLSQRWSSWGSEVLQKPAASWLTKRWCATAANSDQLLHTLTGPNEFCYFSCHVTTYSVSLRIPSNHSAGKSKATWHGKETTVNWN